jgi:uncharacterized protein (DUF58 family)
MGSVETYLRPDVIQTIGRLDLKARFIVEGFLSGLHRSPFHGFSVEFSEHRKYVPGDEINQIDWKVYARTDKYYIKRFEAETNMLGHLVMDRSASMNYASRPGLLTKFEYAICLAAAMAYLMIRQRDPVGLTLFDETVNSFIPPGSKTSHLTSMIAELAKAKPSGKTDGGASFERVAEIVRSRGIVMIFSDLMCDDAALRRGLRALRFRGHDVVLFHVLDPAEVGFDFDDAMILEDLEDGRELTVDPNGIRAHYRQLVESYREELRRDCASMRIDYVPLETSTNFGEGLRNYLMTRSKN